MAGDEIIRLGSQLRSELLSEAAAHAAYPGLKASRQLQGPPRDGSAELAGLTGDRVLFTSKRPRTGVGGQVGVHLIVPKDRVNEPELYDGIFMQLGTYLEIEQPVLRMAVDMIFDPINLAIPGTNVLLNGAGRAARFATRVASVTKDARTLGAVMTQVERGIEFAAKASANPALREQILTLARSRKPVVASRQLGKLIKGVLETPLDDASRGVLEAIKTDRKALVELMSLNKKYAGEELGQLGLNLGATLSDRLALRQVNPLVSIGKPFAFTRQLMGLGYKDAILWSPASPLLIGGKTISSLATPALNRLQGLAPLREQLGKNAVEQYFARPGAKLDDAPLEAWKFHMEFLRGVNAPGLGDRTAVIGANDKQVRSAVERLHRTMTGKSLPKGARGNKFVEHYATAYNKIIGERAAVQKADTERIISQTLERRNKSALELQRKRAAGTEVTDDEIEAMLGGVAEDVAFMRTALSPEFVFNDPGGVGEAVAGAKQMMNLRVGLQSQAAYELVADHFVQAGARRDFLSAGRAYMEHPELFYVDKVTKNLRLRKNIDLDKYPLLKLSVDKSPKINGESALLRYMEDAGWHPELRAMMDTYKQTGMEIGEALLERHMIADFIKDYVPRMGRFTRKGLKALRADLGTDNVKGVMAALDRGLQDPSSEWNALAVTISKKVSTGKMTIQQARVATEEVIANMVRNKHFRLDDDFVGVWTRYYEGATTLNLFQNTITHIANSSDNLVTQMHVGILRAHGVPNPEGLVGKPIFMKEDPSKLLAAGERNPYVGIGGPSRFHMPDGRGDVMESLLEGFLPAGVQRRLQSIVNNSLAKVRDAGVKAGLSSRALAQEAKVKRLPTMAKVLREERAALPQAFKDQVNVNLRNKYRGRRTLDGAIGGPHADKKLNIWLRGSRKTKTVAFEDNWITRSGKVNVPRDKVENFAEVRKELERQIDMEGAELFDRIGGKNRLGRGSPSVGKVAEKPEDVKFWVLRGFDAPIREAFRAWDKDKVQAMRWFDNLVYAGKSLKLAVDAFHGNVLTAIKLASQPGAMLKISTMDARLFQGRTVSNTIAASNPYIFSAASFGAGAAFAQSQEGDATSTIAHGFAAAFWGHAIRAALRGGLLARRFAMSPSEMTPLRYMGMSGWTGKPDDRSIGMVTNWLRGTLDDLRLNARGRAFTDPVSGALHFMETFEQGLWEVVHNGSKQHYFAVEFAKEHGKLVKAGKVGRNMVDGVDLELLKVSREIMQSANNFFGGQSMARLIKEPEWQFAMRRIILAPDWTLSRVALWASALGNMQPIESAATGAGVGALFTLADHGFKLDEDTLKSAASNSVYGALGGSVMGWWGRNIVGRMGVKGDIMANNARKAMATALAAGYTFMNLMNMANTGRWMWENPEGERFSMMYANGARAHAGKQIVEGAEMFSFHEGDKYPIPIFGRMKSKLSVPVSLAINLINNETWAGNIVDVRERNVLKDAGSLATWAVVDAAMPISVGNLLTAPYAMATDVRGSPAGALGRRIMRATGVQVLNPLRSEIGLLNQPSFEAVNRAALRRSLRGGGGGIDDAVSASYSTRLR